MSTISNISESARKPLQHLPIENEDSKDSQELPRILRIEHLHSLFGSLTDQLLRGFLLFQKEAYSMPSLSRRNES